VSTGGGAPDSFDGFQIVDRGRSKVDDGAQSTIGQDHRRGHTGHSRGSPAPFVDGRGERVDRRQRFATTALSFEEIVTRRLG